MINVGVSVCLLVQTAKENFELALEVEKENADAMLWLARLHLYYNIPQACLRRYSCHTYLILYIAYRNCTVDSVEFDNSTFIFNNLCLNGLSQPSILSSLE